MKSLMNWGFMNRLWTANRGFRIVAVACICFLAIALQGFAQKDAKAKEYLDKSADAFAKAGAFSAYFTMNIKDTPNKVTESFDGTIELKEAKFHLDTPDMQIWFDGKVQWILQKKLEEVSINEPNEQEVQSIHPAFIFSVYKNGCSYKYTGQKKDANGRAVQEVELIPQGKGSDLTKIVVQFSTNDFMPAKIHIFYKNKIENIIHIHQYQKNLNLPDSAFVFDPKSYPNAEVIDLR